MIFSCKRIRCEGVKGNSTAVTRQKASTFPNRKNKKGMCEKLAVWDGERSMWFLLLQRWPIFQPNVGASKILTHIYTLTHTLTPRKCITAKKKGTTSLRKTPAQLRARHIPFQTTVIEHVCMCEATGCGLTKENKIGFKKGQDKY